ncbi:hypothetical protein NDU88_011111 [Pleurodeles waltl]|uniref:Uncharacterized protein n=1 Tax=Pleurodeles waltl TaxID=8319 RepID=A0AAV7S2R1_PLEWA|nr:hypothetical protein NDU88_011111 [Pleurodeles waltl]
MQGWHWLGSGGCFLCLDGVYGGRKPTYSLQVPERLWARPATSRERIRYGRRVPMPARPSGAMRRPSRRISKKPKPIEGVDHRRGTDARIRGQGW